MFLWEMADAGNFGGSVPESNASAFRLINNIKTNAKMASSQQISLEKIYY